MPFAPCTLTFAEGRPAEKAATASTAVAAIPASRGRAHLLDGELADHFEVQPANVLLQAHHALICARKAPRIISMLSESWAKVLRMDAVAQLQGLCLLLGTWHANAQTVCVCA